MMIGDRTETVATAAAGSRLAAAAVLSSALHLGVMFGVGVGAEGGDTPRAAERSTPELRVRLIGRSLAEPSRPPEARPSQEDPIALPQRTSSHTGAAPSPGGGVSAPRYFFSSELGRRPETLAPIVPRYPDQLQTGPYYVILRVFIDEHGSVDDVVVLNADRDGAFEKSARAAFAQARFLPGQRDGVPVRSQMLVEVKFDPGIEVRLADEPAPNTPLPGRQATQTDPVPRAARAR